MAKVFGASGRYVADQARAKRLKSIIVGLISVALIAASPGFLFGRSLPDSKAPPLVGISIASALLIGVLALSRWCVGRMDALEKERLHMQRGADGESSVARVLATFPDDFHVIHDITTPFGNIDHVVTGPTGVFVIDAKTWRGGITADGKGELLLNGRPSPKPEIRRFVARTIALREKVTLLAPAVNTYYNALFVFTAARVDAIWGTTGRVNCIRDDQLFDYIVETNFGKRLKRDEVDRLAQAFLAVARMDTDFSQPASVPRPLPMKHPKTAVVLP